VKWDDQNAGVTEYVAFVSAPEGRSAAVVKRPVLDWRATISQLELIGRARAVYFSTNELSFNAALLDAVTDGTLVLHNLGFRLEDRPSYIHPLLTKTTILIGNRVEMKRFERASGMRSEEFFARSKVLQHVIVTAGAGHVRVFSRYAKPQVFTPNPERDVRSPVGAGDSLAAGVLWSILFRKPMSEAVTFGMALAVLAVRSERSYPDLAAVAAATIS
jgi:sugar/nucleoside kinase (ribokinase family)